MEELYNMIGVDNQKASLNLLIDIKTNLLLNRRLLIEVLSKLEDQNKDSTFDRSLDDYDEIRKKIIDHLPKILMNIEKSA